MKGYKEDDMKEKICCLFTREGLREKIFEKGFFGGLEKLGEVSIWDGKESLHDFCRNATIIVTTWGSPRLDVSILDAAPGLKLIYHAAGTVKFIIDKEIMERGIRVSSAANILAKNVAETTFGLMLVAVKKIPWWSDFIKNSGEWRQNESLMRFTDELSDVNSGIISMSHVGKNLISLLKRVTSNILVFDPYWTEEAIGKQGGRKVGSIYDIAAKCDVIALCTPLLKATEGMLDKKFFKSMRDGAVFVNAARGAIIDEEALVEELQKERIFACLDVTNPEPPPPDSPLRKLKNILLCPHVAGCVGSGLRNMGRFGLEEIKSFVEGGKLANEIKAEKIDITA